MCHLCLELTRTQGTVLYRSKTSATGMQTDRQDLGGDDANLASLAALEQPFVLGYLPG